MYPHTRMDDALVEDWITRHRVEEMRLADTEKRRWFSGYFPHMAATLLDEVNQLHHDNPPSDFSPRKDRIGYYYPSVFPILRQRLSAMFVQPELGQQRILFERLEREYHLDLAAADRNARHLQGEKRQAQLHEGYARAFGAVYPPLRELLEDLVCFGDQWKR